MVDSQHADERCGFGGKLHAEFAVVPTISPFHITNLRVARITVMGAP